MERNKKKLYTEIKKKTNRFIPDMILFTYFDVFDFFVVLTRKKNGEDEIPQCLNFCDFKIEMWAL
jgi:hypothetical protein